VPNDTARTRMSIDFRVIPLQVSASTQASPLAT
jgi:hypothetical protein